MKDSSVSLKGVHWTMFKAAIVCEPILKRYGEPELVITGGSEPAPGRKKNTLHKDGKANDYRNRNIPLAKRAACRDELQKALGDEYDVVLEEGKAPHYHVEYQP